MQSKEELIKNYQEKINYIEDQIRDIEAHIRRLDAFEMSEMRRNLPNQYKNSLHTAVSKAKSDAGIVKNKAVDLSRTLKSKIHSLTK
ncbi:hypothetical protein [Ferrimicrobium sp.]|uniref:hypothetical protein n=1 Tax=Ferrimicrobium sp. TaxID=2926050 RepID=UPI002610D567|nr:hypothetical protein [Ferrimicrobium sp.]